MTARVSVLSLILGTLMSTPILVAPPVGASELSEILRSTPDRQHGAELFRNCVACHGADGLGSADGSVPMIAGQHAQVIAKQLADYRQAKRWDSRMERISDRHVLEGPQDIADVAAFASALDRPVSREVGEGMWLECGAKTYDRECTSCHGAAGEGDARKLVPRLAGQHYEYLLRQMYDAVDSRRPNFSRAHVRLLKRFVVEDFEGVADHLSRIEPSRE